MFEASSYEFDSEEQSLPAERTRYGNRLVQRLEGMPAGPQLGRLLAGIETAVLTGRERIAVVRAQQRMVSHHQASLYEAMASVVDHMRQLHHDAMAATESGAAEIGVALRLTRRATDREVLLALDLHERLPRVRDALGSGAIDRARAWAFVKATEHLSIVEARRVVDMIIEEAPQLTTGQLFARLRKLCLEANPTEAADRYEHAVEERRVVSEPTTDGTMNLHGFDLPPDLAAKAMARINGMARQNRNADDGLHDGPTASGRAARPAPG